MRATKCETYDECGAYEVAMNHVRADAGDEGATAADCRGKRPGPRRGEVEIGGEHFCSGTNIFVCKAAVRCCKSNGNVGGEAV